MKIDNIKINGFGQLKDKEIEFSDGINIVYGENEAGKSTILKFIGASLFGISKNKNGKNISDFDKYKPWDGSEFSGKIKYTLQNGEEYQIFREFKKKNPIVYNSRNEDISKSLNQNGVGVFEEQIGVDEGTFFNTAIIQQQGVKLEKSDTNSIVQKMSNLVTTGDDNISFKKSIEKLNKMQLDSVGTDRSKNKPMNIVKDNISKLKEKKKSLVAYKENASNHDGEKEEINRKIAEEQTKKVFLRDVKLYLDDKKVRNAELDFEKNLEVEQFQKVKEIEEKICVENGSQNLTQSKTTSKILMGLLIAFVIIAIAMFVFVKNVVISGLSIVPIVVISVFLLKNRNSKMEANNVNQQLCQEYEIEKENYNQIKLKIEKKEKEFFSQDKQLLEEISDKYQKRLNSRYIAEKSKLDEVGLETEMEYIQNAINQLNFRLHILENNKANVDEKLEELTRIEEDLEEQLQIQDELISLNISFDIAKECLENAYEEMKNNISPKFEQKLCEITSRITNGKYDNIKVNDEHGLSVEVENGAYMPVDRLSVGTIDEMYLSLRISTLEEIAKENLPIIFDESFAYFDNKRLKNIMLYLQDQNYDNQIIIFTCSNREEEILNELKIEYNLINLEK